MNDADLAFELELERAEAIERARRGLLAFTASTKPDYEISWHHRLTCKYLNRFVSGEIKRLMIFEPPRHGKSELTSRRLPAFIFGRNPRASVIGTSYSADLASRMNRDVQRIIDSDAYREIFPLTRLSGENVRSVSQGSWLRNSDIFEIVGYGGTYRSAGVGGGITGMGGDFLLIDDPIKNQEEADSKVYRDKLYEWYTTTLYTRLEKEGGILVTLTRWHEDDLAGRLLELAKRDKTADQWTVLELPAIRDDKKNPEDPRKIGEALWPSKYSIERLSAMRSSIGSYFWNALYQQRPTSPKGSIIQKAWMTKRYANLPDRIDEMVLSLDCSFKDTDGTDFVAMQVWARRGADRFLVDRVKLRLDIVGTIRELLKLSARYPKAFVKLVEDKANGPAVIALLKGKLPGLIAVEPMGSKEARARAVAPEWEAGNVYLPESAPWLEEFITEVSGFPKTANDDEVDAMTQALIRFQSEAVGTFTEDMIPSAVNTIANFSDAYGGAEAW